MSTYGSKVGDGVNVGGFVAVGLGETVEVGAFEEVILGVGGKSETGNTVHDAVRQRRRRTNKYLCIKNSLASQRLAFAEHGAGADGGTPSEQKKAEA